METIKKVAVVTGASQPKGIGRAIALSLAKEGIDVAVTGFTHMDGAQSVAEEIKKLGVKSLAVKMDARNYASVEAAMGEIKEQLGPINILVNNVARIGHMVTIAKITVDDWEDDVKTTLFSAFYCIKAIWPDICKQNWGRIITISSVSGLMGGYGQSHYSSGKAAIIGLTKSVALEGAKYNITANCVAIGVAATESFVDILPPDVVKNVEKRTIWGRSADASEIAPAVVFLVSDGAHYMTGSVVNMLGGLDLFVF